MARIVAGAALVAASFFVPPAGLFGVSLLSGAAIAGVGASLAIGGVSSFLQRRPTVGGGILDRPSGRLVTVQQTAAPTRGIYGRQMVGFGNILFADLVGPNNEFLRICGTLCNHEIAEVEGIYFDGKLVTEPGNHEAFIAPYTPFCFVETNYGGDNQPALAQLVADSTADGARPWTSAHRARGHAHIYLRLEFDPTVFPGGRPGITFLVKGKPVYDPRSMTTAFSANAALVMNDYLENTRFGLGMPTTRINQAALIAAANLCDENVTITDFSTSPPGSTTEKRYEIHGVFETSEQPGHILAAMHAAMGGAGGLPSYIAGEWHILPGAYRAPELALDESDLCAGVEFQEYRSRKDLPNGVKGTFISPERAWKETDFPAVSDAAALAEDNDERIWLDLNLQFTISPFAAQRLAWLTLQRARRQISGTITTMLQGYSVQPGNTIQFSLTAKGWTNKEFEVAETSLTELPSADGSEAPAIGVVHQLRENDASIYDDFEEYQETPVEEVPDNQITEYETFGAEDCAILGGVNGFVATGLGSDRTPQCASTANPPQGQTQPAHLAVGGYAFTHRIYRSGTEANRIAINVGFGRGGDQNAASIEHIWEFVLLNDNSVGPKVFGAPPGLVGIPEPIRFERGMSIRSSSRAASAISGNAAYPAYSFCFKGDNYAWPVFCNTGGLSPSSTAYHSIFGNFFESTEARAQAALPGCTLTASYLRLSSGQPAGGSEIITVMRNGAATLHTFTVEAGAPAGAHYPLLELDEVFSDGDLISVKVQNNDGVSAGAAGILSLAFLPTVRKSCLLGFRVRDGLNTVPIYYAPSLSMVGAGNQTQSNMRFPLPRPMLVRGVDCRLVLATVVTTATGTAVLQKKGVDTAIQWDLDSTDAAGVVLASGEVEFDGSWPTLDDIDIKISGSLVQGFISDITILGRNRYEPI